MFIENAILKVIAENFFNSKGYCKTMPKQSGCGDTLFNEWIRPHVPPDLRQPPALQVQSFMFHKKGHLGKMTGKMLNPNAAYSYRAPTVLGTPINSETYEFYNSALVSSCLNVGRHVAKIKTEYMDLWDLSSKCLTLMHVFNISMTYELKMHWWPPDLNYHLSTENTFASRKMTKLSLNIAPAQVTLNIHQVNLVNYIKYN